MWADGEAEGQAGDGPGQTGSLCPPARVPVRSETRLSQTATRIVPIPTAGTTALGNFQKSLPIPPNFTLRFKDGPIKRETPEPQVLSRAPGWCPAPGSPHSPLPRGRETRTGGAGSGGPTGKALPQHRVPPENTVLGHWHIWGAGGMARTGAPPGKSSRRAFTGLF